MWKRFCMEVASCGMHRVNKSGVGTWGAFVGLILQFLFIWAGLTVWQIDAAVIAAFIVGLIITEPAEDLMYRLYGPRKRHNGEIAEYDFNQDCFDEVIGQLVAGFIVFLLWASPLSRSIWLFVAFGLFRLWDILKPWPIKKIEKLFFPGSALGIILDDVIAGILVWPILFFLSCIV